MKALVYAPLICYRNGIDYWLLLKHILSATPFPWAKLCITVSYCWNVILLMRLARVKDLLVIYKLQLSYCQKLLHISEI